MLIYGPSAESTNQGPLCLDVLTRMLRIPTQAFVVAHQVLYLLRHLPSTPPASPIYSRLTLPIHHLQFNHTCVCFPVQFAGFSAVEPLYSFVTSAKKSLPQFFEVTGSSHPMVLDLKIISSEIPFLTTDHSI